MGEDVGGEEEAGGCLWASGLVVALSRPSSSFKGGGGGGGLNPCNLRLSKPK